jgi:heme-degrading monooxygenase HmoA
MTTVETIRFRLNNGVNDVDFLRRNYKVENEYMARRPGFRSRETARSEAGEWLVTVHWATEQDADATIAAFFGAPEAQDFLAVVDKTTVSSGRYELVE